MKIKSIHTYHAVTFKRLPTNFFTNVKSNERRPVELEANVYGVSVKLDDQHILVPFSNIKFVEYYAEPVVEEKPPKSKQSN